MIRKILLILVIPVISYATLIPDDYEFYEDEYSWEDLFKDYTPPDNPVWYGETDEWDLEQFVLTWDDLKDSAYPDWSDLCRPFLPFFWFGDRGKQIPPPCNVPEPATLTIIGVSSIILAMKKKRNKTYE